MHTLHSDFVLTVNEFDGLCRIITGGKHNNDYFDRERISAYALCIYI